LNKEVCEKALKAKLAQQGVQCDEAGCTPASLAFVFGKYTFFVPRPFNDMGWTGAQQERIATDLEFFGLELWPLDYNV
jgi:hypothetical protein